LAQGRWIPLLLALLAGRGTTVSQPAPRLPFRDITADALRSNVTALQQFRVGVGEWAERLDAASGIDLYGLNGVAAGDYDGDGWDDIFVCQPGGLPSRLLRNRGDGTFHDATQEAGLPMMDAAVSAVFADFDNDGDRDLFVVRTTGIVLFENRGAGRFARSQQARFDIAPDEQGAMMMAALADYDRDGFVDLYVCAYSRSGSSMGKYLHQPTPYYDANNGPPNHLFRNNGDGTFSDVTRRSGLSANNSRWSFAAAWSDYDNDGDPDLYVANDFGRNNLYRNNGNGTFTDVAAEAGVEDIGAGMSVAWGDYDNDGRQDLYVSNIWSGEGQRIMSQPSFQPSAPLAAREMMRRFAQGNSLFRNRGSGRFDDPPARKDVAAGGWAWSSDFLDADGDGWEDILILNGHISNERTDDLEKSHWTDVVGTSPVAAVPSGAYAAAWRQFQNLMNESGFSVHGRESNKFYRNVGSGKFSDLSSASGLDFRDDGRAFAMLDLDHDGDVDLVLKNRSAPQVRIMQNESEPAANWLGFDLVGRKSNRDAIGARITFTTANGVRVKEVRAGSGFLSQHSHTVYFGLGAENRLGEVRIDWPSGLSQVIRDVPAGGVIRVEEGLDRISSSPFSAQPKRYSEATVPGDSAPEARGTWLLEPVPMPRLRLLAAFEGKASVVTLRLGDGGQAIAEIRSRETSRTQPVAPAELRLVKTVIKNLFARRREPMLPFALLFDEEHRIARVYRGAVAAEIDLGRIPRSERERAALALPFPLSDHGPRGSRLETYFLAGFESLQNGSDVEAMHFFEQALRIDGRIAAIHGNIGAIHARRGRVQDALTSYRKAAQLDPDSGDTRFNLGTALAAAGRLVEASMALRRATEIDPSSAEAWANLGNVYLDLEKPDEARGPLERALRLKPTALVHNSLGTLHFDKGELDLAQRHFESAIRLEPGYDAAYVNLGHVFSRRGDRQRALDMFREAARVNPANSDAKRLLERHQ
jgi:tetratricopeptide (TPR) repeat protein